MVARKPPKNDAQLDLFSAVLTDIVTKDLQETMEVPFLSLSKKPRFKPIIYEANGVEVTVTGGPPYGIANIWDWDLMMWVLSQIRLAIDQGKSVSRKIRFNRRAFLKSARRETGGIQYRRLEDSIARLKNTNVVTTIRAKGSRTVMFSWLEYASIDRDSKGRIQDATVVIPEWLFEAVCDKRLILTLHPDYFLLTGGIERWLYRLIRKQAGSRPDGWKWKLDTLHQRSGSVQRPSDFALVLRSIVDKGHLLDYSIELKTRRGQQYLFAKRIVESLKKTEVVTTVTTHHFLHLKTATYEKAKLVAPGYDVYALEADWKSATKTNNVLIKNPDAAFIAWCKSVSARNPLFST